MKAISLLYHDVVEPGAFDTSGFDGADANTYKLEAPDFRGHVESLGHFVPSPRRVNPDHNPWTGMPLYLTFDDGGVSAHTHIAGILERAGWRGHFFVTTACVGQPCFLSAAQIRDLHARGHVVGSHSHTHPLRMADLSHRELTEEWRTSVAALADILGAAVTTASIPGGLYSHAVAETAAAAGIRALFTSEPTAQCWRVDGCLVLGRYAVRRDTPASEARRLALGHVSPRLRQAVGWKAKLAAKRLAGKPYLAVRRRLLR